jgi:hypothetical protein
MHADFTRHGHDDYAAGDPYLGDGFLLDEFHWHGAITGTTHKTMHADGTLHGHLTPSNSVEDDYTFFKNEAPWHWHGDTEHTELDDAEIDHQHAAGDYHEFEQ